MANEQTREAVTPTIGVIGISNKNGSSMLQQSVVADPLPNITGGMNVIKQEGINGKGELKEYGANPMTAEAELVAATSEVAKAYIVAKKSLDAKRFVFKFPEEPNASIHVIYDMRNTQEPLAIFKKTVNDNKELVTEKLNQKEIEIVARGSFKKEDIAIAVKALASTLNAKTIDTDSRNRIATALKEANLLAPRKLSELFEFIKVYDKHLSKTDENIKALKMAVVVEGDLSIPKGGLENLSGVFNPMKLNGLSIKTYQNAMDIKKLVSGEVENEGALSMTEKAFLEHNEEAGITAFELIEAEKIFGVDASGNIIVAEDGNVPYQSGGAIHEQAIKNRIADALQAKKVIDGAFWANANSIDPVKYPREEGGKNYSEAEIAQAEKVLQEKAEKAVEVLGEDAVKSFEKILGDSDPIVTGITSGNIEKMQKAQNLARTLMAVVRTGATKQAIAENPLVLVKDGYFKDGRQLGQANSSPKLPMAYDAKNGDNMINVVADIPKLIKTVGDDADSVVNLKTTKMTVMQVVVDKDGVAKDIMPVNTLGAWGKQQALGRILKSLLDIKGDDDKLEQKFKNLINFGGKLNDKDTNFGLGAVAKDDTNAVGQYFKSLISEIRSIPYVDGKENFTETALEKVQEKIAALVNSEDYSTQNLGKQIIALQKRSDNFEDYFFRAGINTLKSTTNDNAEKREHLKDVMLRVLNGEEVLPTKGATLSIAKTGAVVKAYIDPVRKGVDENIMKIARDMGYRHGDLKTGKIFGTTQEGRVYIKTNYFNENILGAKELQEIKKNVIGSNAGIDFAPAKETMQKLQEYYNENKEVFVKKTSFYTEDEELGSEISIDMDDDLAEALSSLRGEEVATEAGEQDQVDQIAEMEENLDEEIVVNMDNVQSDLFADEYDVEEDVSQSAENQELIKIAQSVTVDF